MESEKLNHLEAKEESSPEEMYLKHLSLNWDDLRGKRVLEVGASYAAIAAEGKKRGVDIISLDQDQEYDQHEGGIKEKSLYVQGQVEALPIKEETMDVIFSMCGPMSPWYGTQEEIRQRFAESWRALKNGGKLFIWPAWIEVDQPDNEEKKGRLIKEKTEILLVQVGDLFDVEVMETKIGDRPFFGGDFTFVLTKKNQLVGSDVSE
jgi:SAM-dependent methyltransferase